MRFTPHGGSPETVPATSTDTQALYEDLECRWLADSALQWKSARIPWFEDIGIDHGTNQIMWEVAGVVADGAEVSGVTAEWHYSERGCE